MGNFRLVAPKFCMWHVVDIEDSITVLRVTQQVNRVIMGNDGLG